MSGPGEVTAERQVISHVPVKSVEAQRSRQRPSGVVVDGHLDRQAAVDVAVRIEGSMSLRFFRRETRMISQHDAAMQLVATCFLSGICNDFGRNETQRVRLTLLQPVTGGNPGTFIALGTQELDLC